MENETNEKLAEELYQNVINGIDLKVTKVDFRRFPNSIFWFFPDGAYAFHYNYKKNMLFVEWSRIIKPIYNTTKDIDKSFLLLKTMLEKYLSLKDVAPTVENEYPWTLVEEYFGRVREGSEERLKKCDLEFWDKHNKLFKNS